MKTVAKLAAGAVIACGMAVAAAAPADAGVQVGVGFGFPVAPAYPAYYGPAYPCNSPYADPYYCDYPAYYGYYDPDDYYAPGFIGFSFGGGWHDHDRWHRGWRH